MTGNPISLKHGGLNRLSAAAGVSASHLSLFFSGRRNIGRFAAVKLERATGVCAGLWMIGGARSVLEALAAQGWPDIKREEEA